MSTTRPGGMMKTTLRQQFDVGDLVILDGPIGATGERGIVTKSKRITSVPASDDYQWHKDEYHCLVRLFSGEVGWVRAKFLKILAKAEKG